MRLVEPRSATVAVAGLTALVSLVVMAGGLGDEAAVTMGFIAARLSGLVDLSGAVPAWLTPLSSTLVHGGMLHVVFNLLLLVWVGAQVEKVIGAGAWIAAYIVGAFAAAGAQWLAAPDALTPMIGASGAISALFGIYALMFGAVKPFTRSPAINRALHAAWLLVAWIILQAMTEYLAGGEGVLVATPAHIGGFVAGLLLQRPLLLWRYRGA